MRSDSKLALEALTLMLGYFDQVPNRSDLPAESEDAFAWLQQAARGYDISLEPLSATDSQSVWSLLEAGFAILRMQQGREAILIQGARGPRRASVIRRTQSDQRRAVLHRREITRLLAEARPDTAIRAFLVRPQFEVSDGSRDSIHHVRHMTPLERFSRFLRIERQDVFTIVLFALVAGGLSLVTPLAVESMVNVVSWGTYVQPLLVLSLVLLAALGFSGLLRILQTVLVEMIQRRQFVRVVGDLSHRFPRVDWRVVEGKYPRELANRLFDIVTIQKATSVLLFDGVALALTTFFGMLLLAFYHPYLLGFVIVLLFVMISLTWLLGRGGVRTAIAESAAKYEVAHWLQDVIAFPSAFRVNGGEALAVEKANRLTVNYLRARRNQFRVLLRQVAFAIGLQVLASTVILGLGGWLVISRELTLGQLVASELVVTIVVGAFAKAGKSIEKFYDLMAGVDKVGHLLDLPILERMNESRAHKSASEISWEDLTLSNGLSVPAGHVGSGEHVAVVSGDANHVSEFLQSCAGLISPKKGTVEVDHEAPCQSMSIDPGWIGYAGGEDVFRGTVTENLQLGRMGVTGENIRETLRAVQLWDEIGDLPDDLQTLLQTGGYPLTRKQVGKLMLARAMVAQPGLLLIDRVLDELPLQEAKEILQAVRKHVSSTIIIGTQSEPLASLLDQKITLGTTRP